MNPQRNLNRQRKKKPQNKTVSLEMDNKKGEIIIYLAFFVAGCAIGNASLAWWNVGWTMCAVSSFRLLAVRATGFSHAMWGAIKTCRGGYQDSLSSHALPPPGSSASTCFLDGARMFSNLSADVCLFASRCFPIYADKFYCPQLWVV